jgi:hypothetical protein
MVRRTLACISIVASLTCAAPCGAQAADAAPEASDAGPKTEALPVTIKLASTPIQAEAVRAAIEAELRVAVRIEDTAPAEGLSVSVKWRRATVSYRSQQGETTTRSLDLPANAEQAVEVIALLAGNLARDEASELLARLAPPPNAEPEPSTTESPAATAETPSAETPPAETPPAEAPKPPAPTAKPATKKPTNAKPVKDDLIRGPPGELNLSLWYPMTYLKHTERRALRVEFGLAYSRVGAIEGVGFTGGFLHVEQRTRGAIGAFGWTRTDGDVIGLQWGGLVTEGHGKLRGADVANILALRWGNIEGAQMGVLFAQATNVTGAQISAGVATADDVLGAQVGIISSARDVQGGQLNLVGVTRDIEGAQLGLVNVARDIDGGQIGLVNVARSTDFQLGLVNVAERVDGAALGLASIAGNGYVEPTVYALLGDRDSFNAGVKFVAGWTYSLLAAGMTTAENSEPRVEAGGGLHYELPSFRNGPVVDRVALELGGHLGHTGFSSNQAQEDFLHYRGGVALRTFRLLWVFVGYDVSHDVAPFGESVGQATYCGLSLF